DLEGLAVEDAFRSIRERIRANTAAVLQRSREQRCTPYEAAFQIIRERWHQFAPHRPLHAEG
ncbi:MAG: hypothetical protein NZ578_15275, partial [Candidatus Binatia bacterium]|nr:hypothetical protein [Candidatus Binatia bacterium]